MNEVAGVLKRYLESLSDGDYIIRFGKHEGERLSDVIRSDYDYIDWVVWKAEFPECVQETIADMMEEMGED